MGVTISAKQESKNASTSKFLNNSSNDKKSKMYGRFLKSGTLNDGVVTKDSSDDSDSSDDESTNNPIKMLTDEELFKACGGRTAHKGARHGLTASGKLARLEAQEMKKLQMKKDESKTE